MHKHICRVLPLTVVQNVSAFLSGNSSAVESNVKGQVDLDGK
jgi:hypothetical protein